MNLWADIDNDQVVAPDEGLPRVRRLTEKVVFSALREWLLRDYTLAYCGCLGGTRIYRRCYWIDALGLDAKMQVSPQAPLATSPSLEVGKGRKKQSAPSPPPPALLPVVSLAQELTREQSPIMLNGLFLAAGSSKKNMRKDVQEKAARSGVADTSPTLAKGVAIPGESGILRASWLEVAGEVLPQLQQVPAMFLLNPLAPALFSHEDLLALYQRTSPTELCLFISHKQIEACLRQAQRVTAQGKILTGVLRTDRWKMLSVEVDAVEHTIDEFIALFVSAMKRHFTLPVQRIAFPMQTRPAIVADVPYTLIFATRRQDSLLSMNDAVCTYRRRVYEQSHRGVLGEEWFAAQLQGRREEEQRELYEVILQRGRSQRTRRWPELRQQILLEHFGQFLAADYDAGIRRLRESGEVRSEGERSTVGDGAVPGNDAILIWSQ